MNEDILKGTWLETKGMVKEKWGKLIDNDLSEIKGKSEILLGRLQKKYGYIRDKAEPEYKDTVELAKIVSSISEIMKKKDIMAIAFIARYGQPLLAKKQESQMGIVRAEKHRYDTDCYFDSRLSRRNTPLTSQ